MVVSAAPVTERARRVLLEAGVELREPDRVADEGWLLENLGDATILIAWFTPIGRRILEAAPALELIVSRSSGVDHIDVEYAEQRGVCVANQPEAIAFAVAEHALGLAIAAAKRLARSHAYALEGRWSREGRPPWIRGRLIRGSTVGVVGMGRIGALVAWYARSMGASRILYWSRRRKPELEQVLLAEPASLERLFRESDVVVVALPKTRETHRLIGCSLLSSMKSGAVLVNVGRGSVIDEEALARVIEERDDIYVALDVFEQEPLPEDSKLIHLARATGRLVLTPHHAGASTLSLEATALMAARQVAHYVRTGTVWNPVNRACREAKDIPHLWGALEEVAGT